MGRLLRYDLYTAFNRARIGISYQTLFSYNTYYTNIHSYIESQQVFLALIMIVNTPRVFFMENWHIYKRVIQPRRSNFSINASRRSHHIHVESDDDSSLYCRRREMHQTVAQRRFNCWHVGRTRVRRRGSVYYECT